MTQGSQIIPSVKTARQPQRQRGVVRFQHLLDSAEYLLSMPPDRDLSLASDRNFSVRESAAKGLARYVHVTEAVKILSHLVSDRHRTVREAAALALGGRI